MLKQAWRRFGPADEIAISEIRQTGAPGIVSALHHVPIGDVWTLDEIRERQSEIESSNRKPLRLTFIPIQNM